MSLLHEWFVEPFTYGFMLRGLGVAALLSVSGGLLGCVLVLRRLALMGDALSHSLLPGIGLAYLFFGASVPALFIGALIAGLLTASGSALLTRLTRVKEEAAFGSLFLICFASGVAIVSVLPARVNLLHFLFGNILGTTSADLWIAGGATTATLAAFATGYRGILLESFDPVFHRAIGGRGTLVHLGLLTLVVFNLVAALQAMGIVLALGLFLLPAVTAYLWCDRLAPMLALAVGIALSGSTAGILLSYHAGIASGAAIVLCLGAGFLGSAILSPRHGLAARLTSAWKARKAVRHAPE